MRNKNLAIMAGLLVMSLKSAFAMQEADCPEFSSSSGGQPIMAKDPTEPIKSIRPNIPLLSFTEPEIENKDQTSPKIESPTTNFPKRKISITTFSRGGRRGSSLSPRISPTTLLQETEPPRCKRKSSAPLERIPVFPQEELPPPPPWAENLDSQDGDGAIEKHPLGIYG